MYSFMIRTSKDVVILHAVSISIT